VEGFGLGLWIARAIVRAHGGEIHIEDTPGGGATVVVELPRRGPDTSGDEGRQ
jgi:signal transduction histidine kinase